MNRPSGTSWWREESNTLWTWRNRGGMVGLDFCRLCVRPFWGLYLAEQVCANTSSWDFSQDLGVGVVVFLFFFFAKSTLLRNSVYTSANTTPLIKNSRILHITVLRLSRHKEVPTSMFPRRKHVGESRVALAFWELKSKWLRGKDSLGILTLMPEEKLEFLARSYWIMEKAVL